MKKTQITNLLTGEKEIYVNNLSLAENLINNALIRSNQSGQLLNDEFRKRHAPKIKTRTSTITGKEFAYYPEFDTHAKYI